MRDLPVLVVRSTAHEILYRDFFLATLPSGLRVVDANLGANNSDGSYLSAEWQNAMCAKVSHALEFCRTAPESSVFLVSDVDVQFFSDFHTGEMLRYFESLRCDMAFQKERYRPGDIEMCCGFYMARNTPAVRFLLEHALRSLSVAETKNEQTAVNELLQTGMVEHAALDKRFYARTHGFPPPPDAWIHHANWTDNVPRKIRQLERVKSMSSGGLISRHFLSYLERMERLKAGERSLAGLAHVHRTFLGAIPLKPGSLP